MPLCLALCWAVSSGPHVYKKAATDFVTCWVPSTHVPWACGHLIYHSKLNKLKTAMVSAWQNPESHSAWTILPEQRYFPAIIFVIPVINNNIMWQMFHSGGSNPTGCTIWAHIPRLYYIIEYIILLLGMLVSEVHPHLEGPPRLPFHTLLPSYIVFMVLSYPQHGSIQRKGPILLLFSQT